MGREAGEKTYEIMYTKTSLTTFFSVYIIIFSQILNS